MDRTMRPKNRLSLLQLILLLLPLAAVAAPPEPTPPGLREGADLTRMPERIELEALDVAKLRSEDVEREAAGKPPRYAVQKTVAPVTPVTDGDWETLADGSRVWRFEVNARDATSVEPGFTRFRLPEGAALYVHGGEGGRVRGPYTHADNEKHGQLWVPIIEGDRAVIELVLEPGVSVGDVILEMSEVLQGYRAFWTREFFEKTTNNCNIDVACNQANPFSDQVRAVAHINISGGLCTGQMINNTTYDRRPLFLTANHCGLNSANAPQMKVYWNYENSFCRTPGTAQSGSNGDGSLDQVQTGAEFLASYASSDFSLVELDDDPQPAFDVFWTGWDRRDRAWNGGASIHHPGGEEKRISIENNDFQIVDGSQVAVVAPGDRRQNSHYRVVWDQGVTEGGSSGSGLWNNQGRLVGQLHGGANHSCPGNNNFDWYGRLWMSWNGGSTAGTRLRDYLDPLGTGAEFIDGSDGDCDAPQVTISINPASPDAGDVVNFRAQGGGSGIDFTWDLDGDGRGDATGRQVTARYKEAYSGDVTLSAVDTAAKCGARVKTAINVKAPDLRIANVGNLQESCGDGDGIQEPGERWELPVTLANQGNAVASNVRAVFTRTGVLDAGGPLDEDAFGNTLSDSRDSNCPYDFVNISGSNRVQFNPSSSFPANDDGGSDPISLQNFPFYGGSVNAVVMSSNGYLATSAARNGGDYDNDCPLPQPPNRDAGGGTGAGRLAVYHDDLITGIAWTQRFNDCPRPGNAPGSGACRVFQWNDLTSFDGGGGDPFDVQAILYEGTGQIVYQYGPETPAFGTTPTVGMQNNDASDGLTWGCQSEVQSQSPVRPDPETAVCLFHADAQPASVNADAVQLLEPAVSYGNIPASQNRTARLSFEVSPQAACGDVAGIGLHGATYDEGFGAGPGNVLTFTVGGDSGQCDANVACDNAGKVVGEIDFQRGMWFNPLRDGHGTDVHTQGNTGFLAWFTYGEDRTPIWYLAVGEHRDNQIHGDLLRFTEGNVNDPEDVGEAIFTLTGETTGLFNWTLDGEPGGEPFQVLVPFNPPSPNRTGHWFPPSQDGWGMTINTQSMTEFDIVYFYDANGDPAWTLGVKDGGGNSVNMEQFTGTCPDCVWTEAKSAGAGTFTRSFSSSTQGQVSTDLSLNPPRDGTWQRNNVNIEILSDPIQ